jgi:hypothetical protein
MQFWQQMLAPPHFQPQNFPPLPPDSLPLPRAPWQKPELAQRALLVLAADVVAAVEY